MKKTSKRPLSFLLICLLCFLLLPVPVMAVAELGEVEAAAALLVDTSYDIVLYEKASNERRAPASITKVMTALLVLEAIDRGELQPETMITASDLSIADITKDSSTQNIQPGEQMSVEHLLYCLLVSSANEAGNILAEATSGTIPAFIEAMNVRADGLGMTNTHFMNPHGLHNNEHYSTAHDIYLMTKEAMRYPLFQTIVSTSTYTVPATNLAGERKLSNTNALLNPNKYQGYAYSPVTGVKTGSTPEAGHCLVSSAKQNERTLIAVVLGAEETPKAGGGVLRKQFSESRRLLKWGFENFKSRILLSKDALLREIPVKNGKGVSHVVGVPSTAIEAFLPSNYDETLLQTDVELEHESVFAPVSQGQLLGSVTVSYMGQNYGTVDLVASNAVEFSLFRMIVGSITAFFGGIWIWIVLGILFLFILLRYLRALRRTPRRKQIASNIKHIDSAQGLRHVSTPPKSKGSRGKNGKAPPRR